MSRNNLLTWYRLIADTSFSSELLQHFGPPFAQRDEVENLHPAGAKLPRAPYLLVLVVQPARADHALLPLHTAVLEATRPPGPAVAEPLDHVVGEERPDPQRPGAGIKGADGIPPLVYSPI